MTFQEAKDSIKVIIVEGMSGAHNRVFLGAYIRILRDLEVPSVVVCSDPSSCRLSLKQWNVNPEEVDIREYRNPFGETISGRWEYLRTIVGQFECDSRQELRLFVSSLDLFIGDLDETLLGAERLGVKWCGLLLRFSMNVQGVENLNHFRILNSLVQLETCQGFLSFDENIVEILGQREAFRGKIFRMPEIIFDQAPGVISTLTQSRKVIVAGHLTRTKNLERFVQVAGLCKLNLEFCMLGKFDPYSFETKELQKLTELVSASNVNTDFVTGGFMSDAEYFKALKEASVIFAVYEDFPYSSNVLSHAAKFGIPVVTQNRFLMSKRVLRFGIGEVAEETDEISILAAIEKAMVLKENHQFEMNCKEYLDFHSRRFLVNVFERLFRAR